MIKKLRQLFFEEESFWCVGITESPIHEFLKGRPRITWIPFHKRGHFLADPFAVMVDGKLRIFVEDYDRKKKKAVISLIGEADAEPVLKQPTHLSYPYLIEDGKDIYMLPESSQSGELNLWKAEKFPKKWKKVKTLLKEPAVDATLFKHKSLWWLLYTRAEDPHGTLYLRYSKKLLGPYKNHPENPVKKDKASARPAGSPFTYKGKLYRPAQDCSKSYGGALMITEITQLSPTRFKEKIVRHIMPYGDSPYPHGIHTLSKVGDLTLVDGKRTLYRLRSPWGIAKILQKALWR